MANPPPPLQLEDGLTALTLDVDPPTPLVCDVDEFPADAGAASEGGVAGGGASDGASGEIGVKRSSSGGGGGGSGGSSQLARTLSIYKSGTIQIAGFEIRKSGLLASSHFDCTDLQDALAPLTVLGRGAGGTVWQGIHVPSLRIVAVKTIPVFEEGRRQQMVMELRALYGNLAPLSSPVPSGSPPSSSSCSAATMGGGGCPQLVSFYDAYVNPTEGTVSIVQEYMDGGSLQDIVDAGGCANETILAHISHQVLQGLAFLHDHRQIHRDIKPANLLINHRGDVKISDFGLVRHLDSSVSQADTFVGTFTYMSPERICGEEYSYSADIWGLGLTMVTCALGRFPYDHTGGYWGLVSALREMDPPELPADQFSSEFRDFVRKCLAKDPAKRPTARRLLTHPFVARVAAAAAERASRAQPPAPTEAEGSSSGGGGGGGESARMELTDIVHAIKAYYRRLWVKGQEEQQQQQEDRDGEESMNPGGGELSMPNLQAKALGGLARQLGLPLATVRRAFDGMLEELMAELEAGEGGG